MHGLDNDADTLGIQNVVDAVGNLAMNALQMINGDLRGGAPFTLGIALLSKVFLYQTSAIRESTAPTAAPVVPSGLR